MSRRQVVSPGRSRLLVPLVAAATVISILAAALAVSAFVIATHGADATGCATVAWKVIPDGAALPSGWSMVSNQIFVDSLASTIAGPTPSSGQRPVIFATITCFGNDAPLAVRRMHEGAIAAGASDTAIAAIGDETYADSSAAAGSTTIFLRRGSLVGAVSAASSVDRTTLESVGRALDTAMVRALAVSADASPIAQPSAGPASAATPAAPSQAPASAVPSASSSAAAESHAAPDLERLLPHTVGTTTLVTQSVLGSTALGSGAASQALVTSLKNLGKTPADLQIAGAYDPAGALDLHLFAYRVSGVDTTALGRAVIESQLTNTAANATSSQVTVGGHSLTKISFSSGTPVYVYGLSGVVYAIQSSDTNLVATVIGALK
jgi:hypothetical protein